MTPRIRLLIVDDQADVRFLIRVIVEEEPRIELVGEADGADTALAELDAAAPDVVLLDAMMPRVDGYELAPTLRERRPGMAIVLLTAHVDESVRERARTSGIDHVLGKDEFDRIPALVVQLAGSQA